MKNIQAQYRDLKEGKLSKANFMANVRRDFSQWISPVNSFDDAVRILKSKRILSEGTGNTVTTTQDLIATDPNDAAKSMKIPAGTEVEIVKKQLGHESNTAQVRLVDTNKLVNVTASKLFSQMTENGDEDVYDPEEYDFELPEPEDDYDWETGENPDHLFNPKWLSEAEKKDPTIDQVDYIQLQKGTAFELSKMPIISDENYAKAKEKAYKNLVKDSNAYRHLSVANYKEVKKKDKGLGTQEVKKDNLADKANEQKTLVKNAKPNTKDTLGKQEKAKKGVPEGVKQLREAMLKEFQAIPEPKKNFAVGHEVATPDGRVGTIEELSQDNTATVKFDDDTVQDYQTNILKPSSEKVIAQHQGAEVKASFEGKKMSIEELKEKLMKSMKETIYKDPETKKTFVAPDASSERVLKTAMPKAQKVPGSEKIS